MEERYIYLLPKAKEWFENVLPMAESSWKIEESPVEQVYALVAIFCKGEPLAIGHRFKYLISRNTEGIWELKTADVRMFGWFPQKDRFVVSACGFADHVKRHNLYQGFCVQAQRDRDLLALNPPKFIPGDDPDDVVSNWHTP